MICSSNQTRTFGTLTPSTKLFIHLRTQNQTRRKMLLDLHVCQTRLSADFFHFCWLEALQNRKCPVFTQQSIVQKQTPDCGVEKIGDRVPVQVDYENSARRHTAHFAENTNRANVIKMVQRQGLDDVIERIIEKRKY